MKWSPLKSLKTLLFHKIVKIKMNNQSNQKSASHKFNRGYDESIQLGLTKFTKENQKYIFVEFRHLMVAIRPDFISTKS